MNELTPRIALASCPLCKVPGFEATKGFLFCNSCEVYIGKTDTAHQTFSAPHIEKALTPACSLHKEGVPINESFVFWFTLSFLAFLILVL